MKQVLMVGEASCPEMVSVTQWLEGRTKLSCLGSATAAQENAEHLLPDLIVVLQSRPGEFSADSVEQLHQLWPLARLVVLLGSWCEGEVRSGKPAPGVWRLYWYEFRIRVAPFLEGHAVPASSSWTLPRSATENERLLLDLNSPPHLEAGVVAIAAASRASYESLSDACTTFGFRTYWYRHPSSFSSVPTVAGIWDVRPSDASEWFLIEEFARGISTRRVVILRGFPRWCDWQRAADMGAVMMGKPFQLPDLWRVVSGVIRTEERTGSGLGSAPLVNCST